MNIYINLLYAHFIQKTIKGVKLNICIVVMSIKFDSRDLIVTVDTFQNLTARVQNTFYLFFSLTHVCYSNSDYHVFYQYSHILSKYDIVIFKYILHRQKLIGH